MSARIWTADEVRALGVRTDLPTACSITGIAGRNRGYELLRQGALPFPTIKVGRKIVVPVKPLLVLLGLDEAA